MPMPEASGAGPLFDAAPETPITLPAGGRRLYLPSSYQPDGLAPVHELYAVEDPNVVADQYDHYAAWRLYDAAPRGRAYHNTPFGREVREASASRDELAANPQLLVYSMVRLAETAETAGLGHLRYGLYGYAQVTNECIKRLDWEGPEAFDDPYKIQQTMPVFFLELAKAFSHHINGRPGLVEGWQNQFYSPAARTAPPAVAMIDFLTAHVRYDLAVALYRTRTEDRHEEDYTRRVNDILTDVAMNIMDKYAEFPTVMRALRVDKVGLRLALWELFSARDEAWLTSKQMQDAMDFDDYIGIRQAQKRRTAERTISQSRLTAPIFRVATRVPVDRWTDDGDEGMNLVVMPSLPLRHKQALGGLSLRAAPELKS